MANGGELSGGLRVSPATVRPLGILLAFGATFGAVFDGFHTYSGTTEYTTPLFLKSTWWVPLLFAGAYGIGGWAYAMGQSLLRGPREVRSWGAVTGGLVAFACLYAASGFLSASRPAKLTLILVGAAALWAWLDRSWQGVLLAGVAMVCGCATEITISGAGHFRYLEPDWKGIPMWLPALYLASAPSVGQFARKMLHHHATKAELRATASSTEARATS